MKAERIFQIGDTKHSRISSACELQKSNFSEKFDQNATKNGRGDNAQIIPAKESGTVRHKERRRKESFRRGERRDDASVKVVPLHINDVIDALKYCQRGSLTAVKQNYSRRKLGKFSVGESKFDTSCLQLLTLAHSLPKNTMSMVKLQKFISQFAALQTSHHTSFSSWKTTEHRFLQISVIFLLSMKNTL